VASSSEDRERFLREARTASSLDHPNIGAIYGLEESASGRSFIVMAYYAGETLAARIGRGPIPLAEVVDIASRWRRAWRRSCRHGRASRHQAFQCHPDQNGVAKIVDFGLARLASTTGSTQTMVRRERWLHVAGADIWQECRSANRHLVVGNRAGRDGYAEESFQRETPAATVFAILNEPPRAMDDVRSICCG